MNSRVTQEKSEITEKILAGRSVRIVAPDRDLNERASNALRTNLRPYTGNALQTVTRPHPKEPGCDIEVNIGSLPRGSRQQVVDAILASKLSFTECNPT